MPKLLRRFREATSLAHAIPLTASRDHLANERTFHAWLRFSMSLSTTGVVLAQMSQIQRAVHPSREREFKYFVLGAPQACICQAAAIVVLLMGFIRFWKQERAMLNGFVRVSGWELWVAFGLLLLVRHCPMENELLTDTSRSSERSSGLCFS